MKLWARWVAFSGRLEDPRPLTLVRIGVPLVILADLVAIGTRAFDAVLLPASMGGVGSAPDAWAVIDRWWWGGPAAWLACLIALPWVALGGIGARPAIAVVLVAYSQIGHLYVPGDRGIDRLLRTVLLVLLFSPVSARVVQPRIQAWASDLVRWILVLVYLGAGAAKVLAGDDWLSQDPPELYAILTDPLAGRLDPARWFAWPWPFRLGGWGTLVVELTSPLILTRWAPWWAVCAAPIHLGIALWMDLGIFSWGMLALYPVLLGPWLSSGRTG